MELLIICVTCFALGCLAAGCMFRKQWQKQQAIILKYEQNVTGLLFSIHHDGLKPRVQRIVGCVSTSKVHFESIEKLTEFALRPNGYNYLKLIVIELKEIRNWFNRMATECIEIEAFIKKNTKQYE
jgi:hypothetical protein